VILVNVKLLLCIPVFLALTACQSSIDQNSGTVISGKVEGWNLSAQKVATQFSNTASSKLIGNGTIEANGQFRLDLPDLIPEADLNTFTGCKDMVLTPDFKIGVMPGVGVLSETGKVLGLIILSNTDFNLKGSIPVAGQASTGWFYTNKNSSARGTCPGSVGSTFTYDVDLKPGWNPLLVEYTSASDSTIRNAKTSSTLTWRFTAY
jgi:hypothetical protein